MEVKYPEAGYRPKRHMKQKRSPVVRLNCGKRDQFKEREIRDKVKIRSARDN